MAREKFGIGPEKNVKQRTDDRVLVMCAGKRKAFSLVELLVVISVISLVMAILLPVLATARSQAYGAICQSNLRQLFLANTGYTLENDGHYVPAAADIMSAKGGKWRWHGVRERADEPFEAQRGPLGGYLADGKVKKCPEGGDFAQGGSWEENFEQGCGGYGYNRIYLGSRTWEDRQFVTIEQMESAGWETTRTMEVSKPSETLMFADTAMCVEGSTLIEYSFAEPPFYVYRGKPITSFYLSPSIHFRHRDRAKVEWADGHSDSQRMADFGDTNVYDVDSAEMKLGWFTPIDNSLFDLK
ncbi:MAG: type II secretion system protein [Planctomycetota bacterium]|jgi:prepilin-type N-terminal cleavage/methylation domain-containing protein